MFDGLRTVIYHVPDLNSAKSWYSSILDQEPYFDESFYVGFEVGGFELGLLPGGDADDLDPDGSHGGVFAYWGVPDAQDALGRLIDMGATRRGGVEDVGGGVRVATVLDPFGNILGVIENPEFDLSKVR